MKKINVALVSATARLKAAELAKVSMALNIQLQEHFAPLWHIDAKVRTFSSLAKVPEEYWPITVRDNIGEPNIMSYHSFSDKRPFVEVNYGKQWTLGASHDLLEMLVDPKVTRTVVAPSIVPGRHENVKYPVQVCDPCASPDNAYKINGVLVSDFSTPAYWDSASPKKGKYSYAGSLTRPFQIVRGGYLSWWDLKTNKWVQATLWGKTVQFTGLEAAKESREENASPIREKVAGTVRFRMVVLQEVYDAQEAYRLKIQTDIEKLIQKFG